MKQLTEKQRMILDLVIESYELGIYPSIRWIGDGVGIRSLRGVTCHTNALIKKGFLATDGTGKIFPIKNSKGQPGSLVFTIKEVEQNEI